MAGDRTEKATPKRVDDARQRGQVARSLELNTAAILLVGAMLCADPARPWRPTWAIDLQSIALLPKAAVSDAWLRQWLFPACRGSLPRWGCWCSGCWPPGWW